jgi:hypothetical protein
LGRESHLSRIYERPVAKATFSQASIQRPEGLYSLR